MAQSDTPKPNEVPVPSDLPSSDLLTSDVPPSATPAAKKKRVSGRTVVIGSIATAVLLAAAAVVGINVNADLQAQRAYEEATTLAQGAERDLREAQQLFDKSVEHATVAHEQGAALIAVTDPTMLSDTALPGALQTSLDSLAAAADLAADTDVATTDVATAEVATADGAGEGTSTEAPKAPTASNPSGRANTATPESRDEKHAAAATLMTQAVTLERESSQFESRTANIDAEIEQVSAAQHAILVAAHTKATDLVLPELASQESKDAFAGAVAALQSLVDAPGSASQSASPSAAENALSDYVLSDYALPDYAPVITGYQNAWAAVVASEAEAKQSQDPASIEPTYIQGILVVNKTYALPSWYGDGLTPETVAAFDQMQAEAAAQGLNLYISSGFRSYWSQESIYNRYVAADGKAEADRYSARPGHSEHQSGLTFDLNTIDEAFAYTAEGAWVRDNAHRFGFVIRYPQGKEHITGYIWEPWHLRYLGTGVASELFSSGLSLEEYLGITSQYAN